MERGRIGGGVLWLASILFVVVYPSGLVTSSSHVLVFLSDHRGWQLNRIRIFVKLPFCAPLGTIEMLNPYTGDYMPFSLLVAIVAPGLMSPK